MFGGWEIERGGSYHRLRLLDFDDVLVEGVPEELRGRKEV